jgi:hypothetical protein
MGPTRQGPACLQDRTDWDRPESRTGPDRTGFDKLRDRTVGTGSSLGPDRTVGTGECPSRSQLQISSSPPRAQRNSSGAEAM